MLVTLVAGFCVLLLWVEVLGPFPGDRGLVTAAMHHHRHRGEVWDLVEIFELLGTPLIAGLTTVALAVVYGRRQGRKSAAIIIAAAGAPALTTILKAAIGPTPPWTELKHTDVANFPSGHVAYAVALFGAAAWLADGSRNRDVRIIFVLLAAAMGPARLALGAHLLSDVLAGICVGGAWLIAVRLAIERVALRPSPDRRYAARQ